MTSRATIGYAAVATRSMATNQGFANLICGRRILPEYLAYWLRNQREHLIQLAGGTTFRELPKSTLKKVCIPLPPLDEQRRIVGILNRAARIERLRRQAQERLQEFVPALFVKMFGDPATNPMGWEVCKLSELSTSGPQYGANTRSVPLVAGESRYVRITDIDKFGALSKKPVGVECGDYEQYRLSEGDLLLARSGATVGKSYLYRAKDGPCIFAGYLIRFRLDKNRMHPEVLFTFTRSSAYIKWIESKQRTAAQPNINGKEYSTLPIPVPPISMQRRFADIAKAAQAAVANMELGSQTATALSASLMSRLLEDCP